MEKIVNAGERGKMGYSRNSPRFRSFMGAVVFGRNISVFAPLANKTVVTKAPHATQGRAELPAVWIFARDAKKR